MKKIIRNSFLIFGLFVFVYTDTTAQEAINESSIDSIPAGKSSVQIDVSFSSKALSSGRDFGVSQYIILPSVSYLHKSGFHAGITANILGDTEPAYNITNISIGYGDTVNAKWSYGFYYARNLFNPDTAGLIQNSLSGSIVFMPSYFNASIQYAYLFGNEKAHRVIAAANTFLSKDFKKGIDNIIFTPGAAFTFGTANVPFSTFTSTQFKAGTGLAWQQWKTQRLSRRQGVNATAQTLQFGLMNIDLTFPVSISIENFQIGFNYTYAIPQQLNEESSSDIKPTGYFGISLGYTIK
jgi:hypothetical protein